MPALNFWSFKRLLALLLVMLLALAACDTQEDPAPSEDSDANSRLDGAIEWERDASVILLRIDAQYTEPSPPQRENFLPLCTLWGDGRLVWVNPLQDERQILEARLADEEIRDLIETVIFSGFYDWQSDFAIPYTSNPVIESITLNLYDEERVISRYGEWPNNSYQSILARCQQISASPAFYLPSGGWVSAYEVPWEAEVAHWQWNAEVAGFSLVELAGGDARWVTGDWAATIFRYTHQAVTRVHVVEDNRSYELALNVPDIARDPLPIPQEGQ